MWQEMELSVHFERMICHIAQQQRQQKVNKDYMSYDTAGIDWDMFERYVWGSASPARFGFLALPDLVCSVG